VAEGEGPEFKPQYHQKKGIFLKDIYCEDKVPRHLFKIRFKHNQVKSTNFADFVSLWVLLNKVLFDNHKRSWGISDVSFS
jgi:hypothetical protein